MIKNQTFNIIFNNGVPKQNITSKEIELFEEPIRFRVIARCVNFSGSCETQRLLDNFAWVRIVGRQFVEVNSYTNTILFPRDQ